MKILDSLFQKFKLHENYLEKVIVEKERINDWTNKQLEGYIDSYFNHGFSGLRDLLGKTVLGEPPIIEACIEVYGQRVTDNLYKSSN